MPVLISDSVRANGTVKSSWPRGLIDSCLALTVQTSMDTAYTSTPRCSHVPPVIQFPILQLVGDLP